MKIVLVLSSPPGYSETFFRSKIKGLQAQGHELILVTGPSQRSFDLCKHIKHPKRYQNVLLQLGAMFWVLLGLLPYASKLYRYWQLERKQQTQPKRILEKIYLNARLLQSQADWLHFGFASIALDRELVAEAIGAKMAVSLRGYDIGVYPLKHPQAYDLLWQKVDKLHSISRHLLKKAYALGLSKNIPFQIISPAVDVDKLPAVKNINWQGKIQLLSVARFNWIKGLDVLIETAYLLKQKGLNFHWKVIGGGTAAENERYAYHIYEKQLKGFISLLGPQSHKQTLECMQNAYLYVQSSYTEGFCNALLEAQAMGKLCVAFNRGGIGENIQDAYTGWLVPEVNAQQLAAQIMQVCALPESQRQQIQQQAQQRVQSQFNLEQQQQAFQQFYSV
ncbi:glycosyltransferase family 4 protein [Mesonia sp. HuA40]|uniref:glycosyltransferase family 4 protein n=1 Tax=Mesonia sp. HuA40 TaxID=2602761 RepID=UPI0011CBF70B|nr:glycosyltransferase family 4 protein [Mesonia sp. HuA40]TXK71932.1 glycosyltransferase family 4 protein [Mesonia sp. HuA40]